MEMKLSFRETKELTKHIIQAERTPFIWGPPGIGKSTIGREIAKEFNAELYILDAPLLQPIDYLAAVPNHQEKKVMLYPSGFLPEKGPAVVLVEDLPHAKSYQQVPLMQMVLDRRIGPMKFAPDVYFIVTGNREEDLAGVNPLPSPLMNRVAHIEMQPELEEWIDWARKAELASEVIGFIQAFPGEFLKLPQEGQRAWPTPRSHHILSDCIKPLLSNFSKNESLIRHLAVATVGPTTAGMFIAYVKYLKNIDPVEIIERGHIPSESARDKLFAIVQSVAGLIKSKKKGYITKHKDNTKTFFNSLSGEFKVTFLKELITYSGKRPNTAYLEELIQAVPEIQQYTTNLIMSE
jgi:hypothetical protein